MEDLSEEAIKENCPHCDLQSQAWRHPLGETKQFRIVADVHSIVKGHILIIPKQHISCIGAYDQSLFNEFSAIRDRVSDFVEQEYGTVSSFEHGKIGQTVFHSHFHLLPFSGQVDDIVPEDGDKLTPLKKLSELRDMYQKDGQYLFFSIGDNKWTVDASLAQPGFFRNRFAAAIGNPERGDWKAMHINRDLMAIADQENKIVTKCWSKEKPLKGLE